MTPPTEDSQPAKSPARLAVLADAHVGASTLSAFAATIARDPRAMLVAWLWAGPSAPPPAEAAGVVEVEAPSSSGIVLRPADASALRAYAPDVLVDLIGTADVAALGLDAERVWRIARPTSSGLEAAAWGCWEVHDGDAVTTTVLLRDTAGGVEVLKEATLRTRVWSVAANAAEVGRAAAQMVAWASGFEGEAAPAVLRTAAAPTLRRLPGGQQALKAKLRARFEWGRRAVTSLSRREQWATGVWPHPVAALLDAPSLDDVQWAPEPSERRFLADPHGFEVDGGVRILVEDLDVRDGRGTISALDYRDGDFSAPHPFLEEPVHLSYPLTFEVEGVRFGIPESSAGSEVVLYRSTPAHDGWQRVATLVRDRRLVDTTLLQRDGRWWMWAGDAEASDNATLTLWSSDDLFGPWVEHPASPVVIDVRRARPAGPLFVHEGRLYRPGQDCSVTYGGRITISEVTELTACSYAEREVATVGPPEAGAYRAGFHTASAVGGLTLVDGKRFARNGPTDWRRALENGLRRLRR